MNFAQPWFLLGALAALIPLLVHLFDRRRPREVPFAALDFVLRSQRRTASRLKLKRILLYLLRTFLFLAVPFALARPSFTSNEALAGTRGLAATAVVLDTSFALRFDDGRRLFDVAKDEVRAALRDLAPEEPATLVLCTDSPSVVAPPGFERGRLLQTLDDVRPGYTAADLNRCLELGARALDDSPLTGRRLVLVSALTQNSLRLEAEAPVAQRPSGEKLKPDLVLRDVARRALPNRALVDVKAEAAPHLGARTWQFTFTVRNFAAEPAAGVELRLEVDGVVMTKGFVDLPAEGAAQKTLAVRFPSGGTVTVTGRLDGDALADDDVREVVVSVPKELTALLINGSPSAQKHRDEAFFTEAALSSPGSPVRAVVRDADAAWKEKFEDYDALWLLNVEAPPAEHAARLAEFVRRGGGLFISTGDRVDADAWNEVMGEVLPRKLRVIKTAVEPGAPDAATRAARLTEVAVAHPVFSPFTGQAREGLLSARFFRYALFESDSAGVPAEVLATMDDGAPVFLAARLGEGRVFVYASTVDLDWSDLAIRTSFLPLVQRIGAWLTGTLDEREEVRAQVGGQVTLTPGAGKPPVAARAPSGVEVALTSGAGNTVSGGPLPEPGVYTVVDLSGAALPALSFAAGLDASAGNLARHELDALTRWAGEDRVHTEGEGGPRAATPLWTWLLALAVVAFFLEGTLLRS